MSSNRDKISSFLSKAEDKWLWKSSSNKHKQAIFGNRYWTFRPHIQLGLPGHDSKLHRSTYMWVACLHWLVCVVWWNQLTWSHWGHWVSCMTILFLNSQVTRSYIKTNIKWVVSLVTAYGHFNLPQGFVWVHVGLEKPLMTEWLEQASQ